MLRLVVGVLLLVLVVAPSAASTRSATARIGRVVDGDTLALRSGARVRLVQIDTPEVYGGIQCYGSQASAITRRLLPPGTAVTLAAEPATDAVDRYGRLLRYVVRARDGLDVNVYLVRVGATIYVVGASEAGIAKLGEVSDGSIELPSAANQNETFREVLSRAFGKKA